MYYFLSVGINRSAVCLCLSLCPSVSVSLCLVIKVSTLVYSPLSRTVMFCVSAFAPLPPPPFFFTVLSFLSFFLLLLLNFFSVLFFCFTMRVDEMCYHHCFGLAFSQKREHGRVKWSNLFVTAAVQSVSGW